MDFRSSPCGYRCEDAHRKHIRVLICVLVVRSNMHLDVSGEFFDCELSIFLEQAVGLGEYLDLCD